MKSFSWKNSVYSAVLVFGTLSALSIGYSALSGGLTLGDKVGTGSGLTASSWNKIVDGVVELDGRTAGIFSAGGNVGIGTMAPWAQLAINSANTDNTSIRIDNTAAGGRNFALVSTANSSSINWGKFSISDSTANMAPRLVIDASGNTGIWTATPKAKLEVAGDFIRTIARAQGHNQADDTDNGAIASRVLTFVKKQNDTGIRITYSDWRRTMGTTATSGTWEAKFNGASCTNPGPVAWAIYEWVSGNDYHRADTTTGTCFGLPAGTYTIQIYVGPTPGYAAGNLYTGWWNLWSLEAEEVR